MTAISDGAEEAYAAWAKVQLIIPPAWGHLNDLQRRAWCAATAAVLAWAAVQLTNQGAGDAPHGEAVVDG